MEEILTIKDLKTNQTIRAFKVQLIDESGKKLGTIERERALKIANERNYDLVEVAPNANPPVCRLMNYGKYKYQQIKKEQKQKTKTKQKETKIIKLSARIDNHDLLIKLQQVEKFLTKKHRVQVILVLRGREMAHAERGLKRINIFTEKLKKFYHSKEGPHKEKNIIELTLYPIK